MASEKRLVASRKCEGEGRDRATPLGQDRPRCGRAASNLSLEARVGVTLCRAVAVLAVVVVGAVAVALAVAVAVLVATAMVSGKRNTQCLTVAVAHGDGAGRGKGACGWLLRLWQEVGTEREPRLPFGATWDAPSKVMTGPTVGCLHVAPPAHPIGSTAPRSSSRRTPSREGRWAGARSRAAICLETPSPSPPHVRQGTTMWRSLRACPPQREGRPEDQPSLHIYRCTRKE